MRNNPDQLGEKGESSRLHPSSCFRKKSLDYVISAMSSLRFHKPKDRKKLSLAEAALPETSSSSRRSSSPSTNQPYYNRSPSPGGYSFDERPFRSRSYSLPLKFHQAHRKSARRYSDWPILRSPSHVEQRFLTLPESAYYQKVKTFGVDNEGNIVERGFCYVHRSNASLTDVCSPTDTSESTVYSSAQGEHIDAENEAQSEKAVSSERIFKVYVIGEESVGRASLIEELKNLFISDLKEADQPEHGSECVIPILVEGNECFVCFKRGSTVPEKLSATDEQTALIIMYDVTSNETFSVAADIMYRITSEFDDPEKQNYVPMLLIGNKVDLERHRAIESDEGKELAKSYGCAFLEISVLLGHQVETVLKVLLNELRPSKKMRRKRSSYRCRKRSQSKNVMAKSEFHLPSRTWFDFLRRRQKCLSLESLF
ncbi:Ras domain containing protein [Trichuris trichiura]|uniref:Ras domain containing protein n=1 Tax=Trichuris trichiura TaxID=36087 RepID=A0A077Z4F7_TRITR|nr:Ras domain containing protein [Trichuris trichiura]